MASCTGGIAGRAEGAALCGRERAAKDKTTNTSSEEPRCRLRCMSSFSGKRNTRCNGRGKEYRFSAPSAREHTTAHFSCEWGGETESRFRLRREKSRVLR